MALNETLRTTPPMLLRDYGSLTPAEQKTVMTETLPQARKQSRELQEQEAMQTIEQTKRMETARADELRRQGRVGQQQIEQAFGELREPEPFVAPTRSPEELASTAFGDLIASLMVGGIAKASAISQLEAIKGMQEARAKNDQLAVDAAYKNWEIAEKQKEAFNKRVLDKLNRIRELMPYEKDAAMAEINLLKPELSGGIAQMKLVRGDIDGAIKAVEAQKATIDKQKQEMAKLEYQRQTQLLVAQEKEKGISAREAAKPKGILKPSAKILEGYIANNILSLDLKGLAQDLQDPELAKQIVDNRAEAFATEEMGKLVAQVLQPELPEKLRRFLTKVRDIRNNYYLDISGKAVTGGEAMRNYGTVPTPGDTPDVIRDKIAGMSSRLDKKINVTRTLYELPDVSNLGVAAGQKTDLVPGQDYEKETDAGGLTEAQRKRLKELQDKKAAGTLGQ